MSMLYSFTFIHLSFILLYFDRFMEVNLANKSLNEFIKIFHTYVPHSFNPYINTYEKILDSVIENGQPEHIPGLWVNYDADHPNLGWPMLAPHMRTQNAKILLKFCEGKVWIVFFYD